MSLKDAFKYAISLQSREVTYHDLSSNEKTSIHLAPSNYFRNLAGPEDSVMVGREFVMEKDQLKVVPKRGDKIIDPDFGVCTIKEIRDMVLLGEISGYRLRTD